MGFSAAWAITGLVMTGVTAVACQATSSARGCGLGPRPLGVLFVLRAVGDAATSDAGRSLRWISPLGWVSRSPPALTASGSSVWAPSSAALLIGRRASPCSNAATSGPACSRQPPRAGARASDPVRPDPASPGASPHPDDRLARRDGLPRGDLAESLIANVEQMLGDPSVAKILAQTAGVSVDQLTTAMAAVYSATMLKISVGFITAAGSPSSFAWRSKSVPAETKW